ncbi:hypothetical protein K461DRAFT_276227 [Myriangium duriaei CBS 260.36]|uniref:Cupin type-2 domain-containing protein n=1 Tax=Myriangium duriaei CBS 260.36 TaxID=1168546 RepID=A0A9P4MMC1_9PEZI|nr:hypothetical protein K461DRAFT_276227 [Myriangium duriaei CBS 260.36]
MNIEIAKQCTPYATVATSIMSARKPADSQLAQELPGLTAYITGHDTKTGDTTIQESRPAVWQSVDHNGMAFNVAFSTSQFPVSMVADADIARHDARLATGKQGLVNPSGTVLRFVDFAPGYESMMHRTQSLDYGIVLEGSIELILDSGEKQTLHRGDCCVQRGTNHAWKNHSKNDWARMAFVLQDALPLEIGGKRLKEDLGRGAGEIPSSGNDG